LAGGGVGLAGGGVGLAWATDGTWANAVCTAGDGLGLPAGDGLG
jgi:hypothetical protein